MDASLYFTVSKGGRVGRGAYPWDQMRKRKLLAGGQRAGNVETDIRRCPAGCAGLSPSGQRIRRKWGARLGEAGTGDETGTENSTQLGGAGGSAPDLPRSPHSTWRRIWPGPEVQVTYKLSSMW